MRYRTLIAATAAAVTALNVGVAIGGTIVGASGEPRSDYVTVGPYRALDTRGGLPVPAGDAPAVETGILQATAFAVNVTVVEPSGPGHVTAWPTGDVPDTSILNVNEAGETVSNFVIVPAHMGGFRLQPTMDAELIVDVMGYFVGEPPEPVGP